MQFLTPLLLCSLFMICQAVEWLEVPICPGPAPVNGWPPANAYGLTSARYTTLAELCAHDASFPTDQLSNLGCICNSDGGVACNLGHRAPLLALFCEDKCECSVEKVPSFRDRITQSWRDRPVDHPALVRKKSDKVMPVIFDGNVKSSRWCGFGCTSFSDCTEYEQVPGCDGLVCQPTEASAGAYFAIGSCVGLGRKRDTSMACSCNSTYVSHSCCGSRNGLVWEDPELKLGIMDPTLSQVHGEI
jgi:hypothetical protein